MGAVEDGDRRHLPGPLPMRIRARKVSDQRAVRLAARDQQQRQVGHHRFRFRGRDQRGKRPLVHRFEAARAAPWTFERETRERDALMGAIVPFRMRIRRVDAKFKLSQNRSSEDRGRLIAALRAEGHPESGETADWMQRYAAPDDGPDAPR